MGWESFYVVRLTLDPSFNVKQGYPNLKNSIRDAHTPQPREIFLTTLDTEVVYQYKV